jgi:predicted RNA-binding Zn ribbon-like protein
MAAFDPIARMWGLSSSTARGFAWFKAVGLSDSVESLGMSCRISPAFGNGQYPFRPCTSLGELVYTCQVDYGSYMDLMFVDFVNSEWYDGHGRLDDRLLKPQWLSAFGRRWAFGGRRLSAPDEEHAHSYFRPESGPLEQKPSAQSSGPRPRMLEELLELRDLLRRIVEAVAADLEVPTRDVKGLNAFLEWADVRHRVHKTPEGLSLETVPLVEADKWLAGAIALSAAEFLASGDRSRLKTCGNSGCRWVFYDDTKNRSRRWCDSNLCGNLFKVRRYRRRHRSSSR